MATHHQIPTWGRSLQKSSSKKTRERRDPFHLRSTVSKHFPTSSTSLPIPSQHPLQRWFSRRNFQKTIIVQRKKKKEKKYHVPYPRKKRSPIFDRFLQTLSNILPLPSQHSLFVRTPQLGQTFPNIPLVRRKKKKRFQGSTTRSSNSSLSNPRPWTVSREPVMRRRNLAGLPGYQVDSEAESPGRRVHLRGCKARGSVGNRHRRAAASVRVFAWARTRPYCRGVGRIGGSSRKRRVRAGHSGGAGAMTSHRGNLVVVG